MAEGLAKKYFSDKIDASSAGIQAQKVDHRAVRVMHESDIDISEKESRVIEAVDVRGYDFIITLEGRARDECPFITGDIEILHWEMGDPSRAEGNEDVVLKAFTMARDELHQRIAAFVSTLPGK